MTDRAQIEPPSRTDPQPTSTQSRRPSGSKPSTLSSPTTAQTARARSLTRVVERAQHAGTGPIASLNTAYINTIPAELEPPFPGDPAIERRLRSIVRWNAIAMVVRANKLSSELGGHIATFQSLATLMEVGYNHFWHAPSEPSTAATSSTSRATRRRATTPARSSRGG